MQAICERRKTHFQRRLNKFEDEVAVSWKIEKQTIPLYRQWNICE